MTRSTESVVSLSFVLAGMEEGTEETKRERNHQKAVPHRFNTI